MGSNNNDEDWNGRIEFIRRIAPGKEQIGDTDNEEKGVLNFHGESTKRVDEDQDDDSDLETDLEEEEIIESGKTTQCQQSQHLESVYRKACRKLKIIPCSPFIRHICDEEIDLSHYNIGPHGAKAVARTLKENTTTTILCIHDNGISIEGAKAFAEMLADNCFITVVDFSMNFIKGEGISAISNVLIGNNYILELSLASTRLNDGDSVLLGRVLKENSTLRSLDLSSNEIGEDGGIKLAEGIKANRGILSLNLSCNHIRSKGAAAIANSLVSNYTMKTLDLSSNGFADFGSHAIGNALLINSTLRALDISQNRISAEGAFRLSIGLELNIGLKVLKIGGNPFQSRGASMIIDSLITNKETAIEEIYFDDIIVSADFDKQLSQLFEEREGVYIQFGAVIKGKEHKRRGKEQKDLISRILDHIELRGIRVVDFFRAMDKTGRLMITKTELIKGLKTAGIPMRRSQVDNLFELFDVDGNGFAQYKEFVEIIRKRTHEEFAATRSNYQWNH
ncbi:leucine-rich repeat-containing protein 74B-like [Rhopilema esculentum]|uniref:leucine-rich repeat-containing protein 74B-like n=1 Tax=Rhopilema esculentum TaxID=499914 RepID=UPI0031D0E9F2|eukprot:gene6086-11471_t